ncbi:MAG: hypothetical protein ACLPIX_12170 [Rhodomicrobium sp.]
MVHGVGAAKLEQYGEAFLAAVQKNVSSDGPDTTGWPPLCLDGEPQNRFTGPHRNMLPSPEWSCEPFAGTKCAICGGAEQQIRDRGYGEAKSERCDVECG